MKAIIPPEDYLRELETKLALLEQRTPYVEAEFTEADLERHERSMCELSEQIVRLRQAIS